MVDKSVMKSSNLVQWDLKKLFLEVEKKHRANVNTVFPWLSSDNGMVSQDINNIYFVSPLELMVSKEKLLLLKYVTLTDLMSRSVCLRYTCNAAAGRAAVRTGRPELAAPRSTQCSQQARALCPYPHLPAGVGVKLPPTRLLVWQPHCSSILKRTWGEMKGSRGLLADDQA